MCVYITITTVSMADLADIYYVSLRTFNILLIY